MWLRLILRLDALRVTNYSENMQFRFIILNKNSEKQLASVLRNKMDSHTKLKLILDMNLSFIQVVNLDNVV